MGWIIAYLISTIVLAIAIGVLIACDSENSGTKIDNPIEILIFAGCCLGWPLTMIAIPAIAIRELHNKGRDKKIARVHDLIEVVKTSDARTRIATVDERSLKFLLKYARKNKINLTGVQIDIVRNELLTRNMERNLTK